MVVLEISIEGLEGEVGANVDEKVMEEVRNW